MAPSIVRLGAAALAFATSTVALEAYQLKESYTPDNFFDKFNFFSESDPNQGFVKYRSKQDAHDLGLVSKGSDEVTIRVDSILREQNGRNSIRLESANTYNAGLFIADFSHFPKQACGAWPAFWMVGPKWPRDGEIDIYEGWSLHKKNKVVLHVDHPDDIGTCVLNPFEFTSDMTTRDCWTHSPFQPGNAGCAVEEPNGLFGNPAGGIYAFEWREDSVKVWSWAQGTAPSNLKSTNPDPSEWGKPSFAAGGQGCDVKRAFNNMRMVLNINFCGDAAGNTWNQECAGATKTSQCHVYVRDNPTAFKDTFWKVRGIKVYQLETVKPATTTTTTSTSSTSTSTTSTSTSTSTTSTSTSTSTSTTSASTSTSTSSTSTSSTGTSTEASTETSTETTTTATLPDDDATTTTTDAATTTSTDDDETCEDDETSTYATESATITSATLTDSTSATATATATETEDETCEDDETSTSDTATATASDDAGVTSSLSVTATTTASYTTSTIYTTVTSTITSCAPEVTKCPVRTVTSVISIGTTVCPVTDDVTATATATASATLPDGWTTSTIYTTSTYTVTSCPTSVSTNCPSHETTTLVPIGTTICPIATGGTEAVTTLRTSTTISLTTTVVVPRPTGDAPGGGGDDGEDDDIPDGGEDNEGEDDDEPTGSFAPSFAPSVTEGIKPSFTVPPVDIVTSRASASFPASPSASATGKVPVEVSGAGRVVGGGVVVVLGAIVALFL